MSEKFEKKLTFGELRNGEKFIAAQRGDNFKETHYIFEKIDKFEKSSGNYINAIKLRDGCLCGMTEKMEVIRVE